MVGRGKSGPQFKTKKKRPNNFWAPFNAWWRSKFEETGKRPTAAEVRDWHEQNSHAIWPEGAVPSCDDVMNIAKGMRSLDQVKVYFRKYRRSRKASGCERRRERGAMSAENLSDGTSCSSEDFSESPCVQKRRRHNAQDGGDRPVSDYVAAGVTGAPPAASIVQPDSAGFVHPRTAQTLAGATFAAGMQAQGLRAQMHGVTAEQPSLISSAAGSVCPGALPSGLRLLHQSSGGADVVPMSARLPSASAWPRHVQSVAQSAFSPGTDGPMQLGLECSSPGLTPSWKRQQQPQQQLAILAGSAFGGPFGTAWLPSEGPNSHGEFSLSSLPARTEGLYENDKVSGAIHSRPSQQSQDSGFSRFIRPQSSQPPPEEPSTSKTCFLSTDGLTSGPQSHPHMAQRIMPPLGMHTAANGSGIYYRVPPSDFFFGSHQHADGAPVATEMARKPAKMVAPGLELPLVSAQVPKRKPGFTTGPYSPGPHLVQQPGYSAAFPFSFPRGSGLSGDVSPTAIGSWSSALPQGQGGHVATPQVPRWEAQRSAAIYGEVAAGRYRYNGAGAPHAEDAAGADFEPIAGEPDKGTGCPAAVLEATQAPSLGDPAHGLPSAQQVLRVGSDWARLACVPSVAPSNASLPNTPEEANSAWAAENGVQDPGWSVPHEALTRTAQAPAYGMNKHGALPYGPLLLPPVRVYPTRRPPADALGWVPGPSGWYAAETAPYHLPAPPYYPGLYRAPCSNAAQGPYGPAVSHLPGDQHSSEHQDVMEKRCVPQYALRHSIMREAPNPQPEAGEGPCPYVTPGRAFRPAAAVWTDGNAASREAGASGPDEVPTDWPAEDAWQAFLPPEELERGSPGREGELGTKDSMPLAGALEGESGGDEPDAAAELYLTWSGKKAGNGAAARMLMNE